MEQEKIGKFIQTLRKDKNLTQAELAEKLNITDRAVSKWERGKSMPDSSLMLDLCKILDISVNELLMGEKIKDEEIKQISDINLVKSLTVVEKNKKKYRIITMLTVALLLCILIFFCCYIYVWNGVIHLGYNEQLLVSYVENGKLVLMDMRGNNYPSEEIVQRDNTVYLFRNTGDYVSNYLTDARQYYWRIGVVNLNGYEYSIGKKPLQLKEFIPMFSSKEVYDLEEDLNLENKKLKVYYVDKYKYMKRVQSANNEEFQKILDDSYLMLEYN